MTWFRLDDKGAFHAKAIMAGNEAYGAWCRAGQWSSQHGTDGVIPRATALLIGSAKLWAKLVAAIPPGHTYGLAEPHGDGWRLHDFLVYNPSAAQVLAERERKQEAGRRGGLAKAGAVAGARSLPGRGQRNRATPDPDPDPVPKEDPEARGSADAAPKARKGSGDVPESIRRYADAFAAGMRDAGAESFTPPTEPRWRGEFGRTLQAHAGGRRGEELDAWIRASAAEYRRARPDDGRFGGFTVGNWRKWLDAGRPSGDGFGARSSLQRPAAPGEATWKTGEEV